MTPTTVKITFDRLAFVAVLSTLCFVPFLNGGIEASLITGLALFFASRFIAREKVFNPRLIPLGLSLLLYIVAVELSVISSVYFQFTFRGLLRVLKYAALYVLVAETIQTERRFMCVLRAIALVSIVACLNGFWQLFYGVDLIRQLRMLQADELVRVTSSFNHPNNLAIYLATVFLILFYAKDNLVWRWVFCISMALCLFVLCFTYSRLPVIFTVFTFIGGFFFVKSYRRNSIIGAMLVVTAIAIYSFYEPAYLGRAWKIVLGDLRIKYWEASFGLIRESFFMGHGVNTFMYLFGQTPIGELLGVSFCAHNFVLQMWVEIGLVGVSAFLFLLGSFYRKSFRFLSSPACFSKRTVFGFVMGITLFLLYALTDNNLRSLQLTTFFWILVGSVMGVARTAETTSTSAPS